MRALLSWLYLPVDAQGNILMLDEVAQVDWMLLSEEHRHVCEAQRHQVGLRILESHEWEPNLKPFAKQLTIGSTVRPQARVK